MKDLSKEIEQKLYSMPSSFQYARAFEPPKEFRDILGLEKVPVARRPLFKKINIMPKG